MRKSCLCLYCCSQIILRYCVRGVLGILNRERGGIVVERRTLNREVLDSIPTGVTGLCP